VTTLPATQTAPSRDDRVLIHPFSALLLIVIDNLWLLADWAALLWIVTIPLSFAAVFLPSFLIQKYVNGDQTGRALGIASFLGVLAAVPTPVTGTSVGVAVLGYAGFKRIFSRRKT
jgi:hypothetical protein